MTQEEKNLLYRLYDRLQTMNERALEISEANNSENVNYAVVNGYKTAIYQLMEFIVEEQKELS